MFATMLLISFTIFVLIFSNYFQQKWKWRSFSHINGPTPLPLLGNILEFGMSPVEILNDIQRLLNNYGKKEGVIKISLGLNSCYLVIADPDLTEFFLRSPIFLQKNINYDLFRPWVRNGLITSTGSYWQKRRKAINPAFHLIVLEQFVTIFNELADIFIQKLSKEADKDVFDIYPYVTAYTLDSICETAMGTSVNAQENPNNEYVQAIKNILNIVMSRSFSSWKRFDFLFQFSKEYQLQNKSINTINNLTKSVIKKQRNALIKASVNGNANEDKNEDNIRIKKHVLLDLLLVSTIDGKLLTDDDITEEVNTFLAAGYDTTASVISFALFELSRNPEIQNKVYEELKGLSYKAKQHPLTVPELNDLKYLELVIKETLRLYPSVPLIGRELQEDVTYKGKKFAKGAQIMFFIYYLQRRPDLFPNPEKFEPERFLPENLKIKNPFAYVPFSAGPRNCIGQKFAMYEIKTVLSKIVLNFELLPVDKKYDLILASEVVLKSANGVNIKLKKRI